MHTHHLRQPALLATVLLACIGVIGIIPTFAAPVGTTFTYQGQLFFNGTAVGDGTPATCDFTFDLYDVDTGGTSLGTDTVTSVTVTDSYFAVELDFGTNVFAGDDRYLEITVDCPSVTSGAVTLSGRVKLNAVPYAMYALEAATVADVWNLSGNAGTTPGTHFLGTTDATSLTLAVDSTPALRIEPNASSPNLIGGFNGNTVTSGVVGATISGGGLFGGVNQVTASYATVGGGNGNTASGNRATVSGGINNTASGSRATVSGGQTNTASGSRATVGGGQTNTADGDYATMGGGQDNTANATYATVGGGLNNTASSTGATVGGGGGNSASGGTTTVGGGEGNTASNEGATVGGGRQNTASGASATVPGGWGNTASGIWATVGGGEDNTASGNRATVGGGRLNTASGGSATVGGGEGNTASGGSATVGGGFINSASGENAAVGGGEDNSASGENAAVGGGEDNTASGTWATVAGGRTNVVSGTHAMVPGGRRNVAAGDYSFAAGRRANAVHTGAFVWADSTNADFLSGGTNTFNVRATGGYSLTTNSGGTTGVTLAAGSGTWASISDRNAKANIALVDAQAVLAQVVQLPITTWNYRAQGEDIRHMGPMAQDFFAAFGLGTNDTTISTVDADGVALASIQGLHALIEEKDARIADLEAENDTLEQRLTDLEARLTALEGE